MTQEEVEGEGDEIENEMEVEQGEEGVEEVEEIEEEDSNEEEVDADAATSESEPDEGEGEGEGEEEPEEEEKPKIPLPVFSLKGLSYEVLRTILTLSDTPRLRITSEGVQSKFMDPSHIMLYDITIPKTTFNTYEVSSEGQLALNITKEELKALTKRRSTFGVDMASDGQLLQAVIHDVYDIKMNINAEGSDSTVPDPKVPFQSHFSIYAGTLEKILSDLTSIDEFVRVSTDQERIVFEADMSGEGQGAQVILQRDHPGVSELYSQEVTSASYNATELLKFLKTVKPLVVTWEFSSKLPLRLTTEVNGAKFIYWLAPRIK